MDTFVVRIYRSTELDEPDQTALRGVVEEASTGSHSTFRSAAELLSILRAEPRAGQSSEGRHQTRQHLTE